MFKNNYFVGHSRNEMKLINFDSLIPQDDFVRLVDSFVDSIDIFELGYVESKRKKNSGRPAFNPLDLIKLYIYGYRRGIRSGRKLEDISKFDIRFIWLLKEASPNFRTINSFRQHNLKLLENVFYKLNQYLVDFGYLSLDFNSEDGVKIKASNSKDNNFTINKLNDRISHNELKKDAVEKLIAEEEVNFYNYLKNMDNEDELEQITNKIKDAYKQLDDLDKKILKHKNILNNIQNTGDTQISLIDKDSRLMPNNGKFDVAYNVQTLVDMNKHFVTSYVVDNNAADVGCMNTVASKFKDKYNKDIIITNITDKGYNSTTDMVKCLELGVIPQVTPIDKDTEEVVLECDYEENEVTTEELNSTNTECIKKCLRSANIPECYKDVISNIEVCDKTIDKEIKEEKELRSPSEIRETAINSSTFERDLNNNIVYCPAGERLSKKCTCKNDRIKYANKLACKHCKNPCTKSNFKEVTFRKNQKTVIPKYNTAQKPRITKVEKEVKKVVKFVLKLDSELLKKRMQTSEHTQGTMKTVDNFSYFNVRGKEMVSGELSIYFTASNLRRAYNLVKNPIELINKFKELNKNNISNKKEELCVNISNISFKNKIINKYLNYLKNFRIFIFFSKKIEKYIPDFLFLVSLPPITIYTHFTYVFVNDL